jgi:uncharacterized protein YqhQ
MSQVTYGGQAVMEGVMMRGPSRMAIAVRRPDGEIAIHQEKIHSVMQKYSILRLPILRGMVALVETLGMGIRALMFSANQAMPDEEQLTKQQMTLTSIGGVLFSLVIFVGIPTLVTHWVRGWAPGSGIVTIVEAAIRLGMFIGYLSLISMLKDIQRVYQYHGAEHKVINTYEAGDPLTVAAARVHSREHKRCGTSFLLYVVVISIVVFSMFTVQNVWLRIGVRFALMPVVAGISFEVIRLMGKYDNRATLWISRPGMWLQGLTTREPDDSQLEVAIAALETAREFNVPG